MFYRGQPDLLERLAQQTPVIVIIPPAEPLPDPMDVGEPGRGTSVVDELSEAASEESGTLLQIVVDEPMPEASHTSKRVRVPEENEQPEKKKQKKIHMVDDEYESCIAHIKEIVEELESSNFTNIREVLGMFPNLEVEHAVGTMVALAGSTKPDGYMPSNCRKFCRELKKIKEKNISTKRLHEKLKEEGFYPRFLSNLKLFGRSNPEQPST